MKHLTHKCHMYAQALGPSFYASFNDDVSVFHTLFLCIICMFPTQFNTFLYLLHLSLSNSLSSAMTTTYSPLFTQQQPIPLVRMTHYLTLSRAKMTPTSWNPKLSLPPLAMFTEMLVMHLFQVCIRYLSYGNSNMTELFLPKLRDVLRKILITGMGCRILRVMSNWIMQL